MHNAAACLRRLLARAGRELADRRGAQRTGAVEPHGVLRAQPGAHPGDHERRRSRSYVDSLDDYRRRVLGGIYSALGRLRGTAIIRHEWVNSRGVILRFDRRAMEVRVLDLQECPKMDVAIAAYVRAVLASLSARVAAGALRASAATRVALRLPACGEARPRRADHRELATSEEAASAPCGRCSRRCSRTPRLARASDETAYLRLIARRLARGSLAEGIRRRTDDVRGASRRRDAIRAVYGELMDCLEANEPWQG